MKLQAQHGFCIGGGIDVAPGEVFDAPSDGLAVQWIASGAAVAYVEPASAPDPAHQTPVGTTLSETKPVKPPKEKPLA